MNLLKHSWMILLVFALAACGPADSASTSSGAGSDSTVAFLCEGEQAQICSMSADGSGFRKLTTGGGPKGAPAINRSGQIVYRCGWRDEELCVVMANGSGFQRLGNTREHPQSPSSYTGVAFLRDSNPSINDKGLIAYSCFDGEDREICVINFDGTGFKMLTQNTRIEDWNPSINNSGQIAYSCNSKWQGALPFEDDLCVINADGSGQKQLTTLYWKNSDPAINDSGLITFVCYTPVSDSAEPGEYTFHSEICSVNFDNTALKRHTSNELTDWEPSINDSGQIAYECMIWDGALPALEICLVDTASDESIRLTENSMADDAPAVNDDGLVLFECGETNSKQLCSVNSDASGYRQLTREPRYIHNPAVD